MKKPLIVIGLIIVSVLVLAVFISGNQNDGDDSATRETQTTTNQSEATDEQVEAPAAGSQGVLAYSSEALAASETKYNVIFFHAAWCSVCQSVQESLDSTAIPNDISIFKVDYDSDLGKSLANQYSIPIQYTMVQVDTDGSEITQWVNNFGDGSEEIVSRLES